MTQWIRKWRKTNFANVENSDLFQRLDALVSSAKVRPLFVSIDHIILRYLIFHALSRFTCLHTVEY